MKPQSFIDRGARAPLHRQAKSSSGNPGRFLYSFLALLIASPIWGDALVTAYGLTYANQREVGVLASLAASNLSVFYIVAFALGFVPFVIPLSFHWLVRNYQYSKAARGYFLMLMIGLVVLAWTFRGYAIVHNLLEMKLI